MPVYTYTAKDRGGNVTSGNLEADTDSSAAASLREQGLWITDLRPQRGSAPVAAPRYTGRREEHTLLQRLFPPVSLKDLSLFYRQLYTLLNSGMALYGSLETLSRPGQSPNRHLRRVVESMGQHVLAGGKLSEAMSPYPWLFDTMQVRMVEAGESGGLLVEIFGRLADYLQREYELRLEIKRKTLYPKILLLALIFIPSIPTLFLRGPAAYAAEIWTILQWFFIAVIPLVLFGRYFMSLRAGREFWDQAKLVIPVIGPLSRKMTIARFARTLSALYAAGVPIATSLRTAGESCGSAVLERHSTVMVPGLERGFKISEVLENSRFFPPMFLGMVSTGETSGNLDQMLTKAAEFYDEESRHATLQLVVILGVVLLLVMAIIIAIKIIGFWGGFYAGVTGAGAGGGE
jgi:type IV pilus assembly protein PilC